MVRNINPKQDISPIRFINNTLYDDYRIDKRMDIDSEPRRRTTHTWKCGLYRAVLLTSGEI